MMPVYFHLESHLWIFYLFIFNGFLIHSLFRAASSSGSGNYMAMTNPLEASLLSAFFISLSLNGCLLLLLDLLDQNFALMKIILPLISIGLLSLLIKSGCIRVLNHLKVDYDWWRLLLYGFVFIILFYNGGLIERIADSWWHMSLANKIGLASSFSLELGHLTGEPTRYYPPLWHANLGLANIMSGESISVFWNSFTAWGGALKVMGFYLLAFALSGNKPIAVLSAVLFVLLPGLGDSYLRVSAWPSHIAYTAMFCMFYIAFWVLDKYRQEERGAIASIYNSLLQQRSAVAAHVVLMVVTLFVHQLELLWFYIGMLAYCIGLTIHQCFSKNADLIECFDNKLLSLVTSVIFFVGLVASVYAMLSDWKRIEVNPDWLVVGIFMPCLFVILLAVFFYGRTQAKHQSKAKFFLCTSLLIGTVLVLLSIDLRQVLSLVIPGMAYPMSASHEWPLLVEGFRGGELKLPGWHLQLRSGLLYSGLLSIPLAIVLFILKPSRLSLFACSNAIVAILFCISPYLYLWLAGALSYHSPWRIAILIFHPIIIAQAINLVWVKTFRLTKS